MQLGDRSLQPAINTVARVGRPRTMTTVFGVDQPDEELIDRINMRPCRSLLDRALGFADACHDATGSNRQAS